MDSLKCYDIVNSYLESYAFEYEKRRHLKPMAEELMPPKLVESFERRKLLEGTCEDLDRLISCLDSAESLGVDVNEVTKDIYLIITFDGCLVDSYSHPLYSMMRHSKSVEIGHDETESTKVYFQFRVPGIWVQENGK